MKNLLAKLSGLGSFLWNFYVPVIRQIAANGTSALLPIALDIVRTLADSSKSSLQKRETAVLKLKDEAVAMGISASESLIRFTIESAVQRMRIKE